MINFGNATGIHLDASKFANDEETFQVASVVTKHAEKRRADYRKTEKPIIRGLMGVEGYWSETVPWYEWMSEPSILQPCAEECGLEMLSLADVIAYQIRPSNWQVFSWMSLAYQALDHKEMLTNTLSRQNAQMAEMRKQSQLDARSSLARTGAQAKLAADPKQRDKVAVRECWDIWQEQPDRYKGKAAFARDMLDKFENLKSHQVIERWCRKWESAAITQQAQ